MIKEIDYLKTAAEMVEKQVLENPEISIPVSEEVAEFMGAFEETAITLDDLIDIGPDDKD